MEFVDKAQGAVWAHPLLKQFLDACLNKSPYPTDLYAEMKDYVDPDTDVNPHQKSTYKRLLEGILDETHHVLPNEHGKGLCCYCMRTIDAADSHSTLEHVIPKVLVRGDQYNKFYEVPSALVRDEHIMVPKDVFSVRHHNIAFPCPHNTSYENLIASCDGSLPKGSNNHVCCNGPRGDHYIPPIAFIPNIHNEIKYKANGVVVWKDNPNVDSRERKRVISDELHLNCSILRMIRFIWHYLSEKQMDCNLSEPERRKVIDTLRKECFSNDKDEIQNFHQDNYWKLLDEYRYFNDPTKFTY